MMRHTTTPQPAGALATALVQLPAMQRDELTVLAAAAQAFARTLTPAPMARQLQLADPDDPILIAGSQRQILHRGARCEPSRRSPARGALDRHRAAGYRPISDSRADRDEAALTAVGTDGSGSAASRLSGSGRLLLCRVPPIDQELFGSRAYRRRIGPTRRGLLYVAGCEGLLALAKGLDEPLYKVGVTEGPTTELRMSMLAATRYGSVVRMDGGWREEIGFDHWQAASLPLSHRRGRNSPVGAALGAIAFERPVDLPREALDRALAAAFEPASLDSYATTPGDRAAYSESGLDPTALERFSPAPHGCPQGRMKRARELVMLGPRADADRLAAMLEAIIAAHVMGHDTGDWRHGARSVP